MNGHGKKLIVTKKGIFHVQTYFCSPVDGHRTEAVKQARPEQSGCSHSPPSSNDSALFAGQEKYRDCPNVERKSGHRSAYHPPFQCRRSDKLGRQAPQRSTCKDYQSLCEPAERNRAKISTGSWLSIQQLDTGEAAGALRPSDRHIAKSPLSVAVDGQRADCISPAKACDGAFARSQGLQRKEGFSGVFKKNATEPQPSFDLLYLDECEVHLHPTLTKVWTLKGTRAVVPAAGANKRLCIYGAFNYRTGQVHYMTDPKKNAECFAQFLSQLLSANLDRFLVLVLDNASYHQTGEILDILTEHEDHVFVVWLPKYSPELNLIDGLWGYLKGSALNNYFYGNIGSLEMAVDEAFEELQQHPETALSLAYKTYKNLCKTA